MHEGELERLEDDAFHLSSAVLISMNEGEIGKPEDRLRKYYNCASCIASNHRWSTVEYSPPRFVQVFETLVNVSI
jgi:hypothetical protein